MSEKNEEIAKEISEYYFGGCACETGDIKKCEGCKISEDIMQALDSKDSEIEKLRGEYQEAEKGWKKCQDDYVAENEKL